MSSPQPNHLGMNYAVNCVTSVVDNNNTASIEQPQTKRQKIEKTRILNGKIAKNTLNAVSPRRNATPPRIEVETNEIKPISSSLSSSAHSISTPSSSNNSPSCSRATSLTHLLPVHNLANTIHLINTSYGHNPNLINSESHGCYDLVNICKSRLVVQHRHSSHDEVDEAILQLPINGSQFATNVSAPPSTKNFQEGSLSPDNQGPFRQDMRAFEESLTKQCLCEVSEQTLRKPFQSHYSVDANGHKRVANLNEWPTEQLVQFLSNLQLLFDIYLKQNSKGYICARIMDVCDALIRNDHNLIDEIIMLAGYSDPYVQFLAGRVLAAFLIIAKQDMNEDWLKKLVDNLFNYDSLDYMEVQKIHFTLEIIKRIVEWKDINSPLYDDEISEVPNNSTSANNSHGHLNFQTQQPTLETNYFAVHFQSRDHLETSSNVTNSSNYNDTENVHPAPMYKDLNNATSHIYPDVGTYCSQVAMTGCHVITLTDSESFDTTHLKCNTIKILENKWSSLVKNMSTLIANDALRSHQSKIKNVEHCVLNFLELWENIISVKANLSIVETLPFYSQLDKFELLLFNRNLSCTVYKQMLCLLNEALCYGSTLALQDMLPDETRQLAHQIVRHVKDRRILDSLPRRQSQNGIGFIGFKRTPINFSDDVSPNCQEVTPTSPPDTSLGDTTVIDKTILQKMVLLVLKSIAVTVKEIRSDSSDSSIDSADYDMEDMTRIERSIRDVLCKLETFIKNTLEFHPESHFSRVLIYLFDDQDDHLVEAMVCTLDVTASFRQSDFPNLVSLLNPVYTFLEFLKMVSNSSDLFLDLLVSNETCFLLYLLRFLKYICKNWTFFVQSCHDFGRGASILDEAMSVLIRLRLQISRLVSRQLYPYDISPVLRLLESCESLYEGNEFS